MAVSQFSTAYGVDALKNVTKGYGNSAFGYQALYSDTTGTWNTADGFKALYNNTTGSDNTAGGFQALYSNTTGSDNTANGVRALYYNTTGIKNTASGHQALSWNSSGSWNTANGDASLGYNTFGYKNTASGYASLSYNTTGYDNAADGSETLYSNTTGSYNTASGAKALYSNTTGRWNTANGYASLSSNITGWFNTGLGINADVASNDLRYATAIGAYAKVKESNTIQLGNDSVTKIYAGVSANATFIVGGLQITGGMPSVGKVLTSDADGVATWQNPIGGGVPGWSLTGNAGTVDSTNFIGTTDNVPFNIRANNQKAGRIDPTLFNTFYGYQSGNLNTGIRNTGNGYASLGSNITGRNNTAFGKDALYSNITGNNNTAIGFGADVGIGNLGNATAIGANATVDASNKVVVGDAAVTVIGGYANWSNLSDERFKKNIQEDVHGLDFIMKLKPISYNMDIKKLNAFSGVDQRKAKLQAEGPSLQEGQAIAAKEAIRYNGFSAQEVEKAALAVKYDFSGVIKPSSEKGHYSLSYSDFVVPLVKGMQEQEQKIEQQEKTITQLQQQIDELKKLITSSQNITAANTTNQTSSVEDAASGDVKVYPNPSNGIFTITTNTITNGIMEVYDMSGNHIQTVALNSKASNYTLNLSGYAKGVYLLNIITNGKKITKKVVVQ